MYRKFEFKALKNYCHRLIIYLLGHFVVKPFDPLEELFLVVAVDVDDRRKADVGEGVDQFRRFQLSTDADGVAEVDGGQSDRLGRAVVGHFEADDFCSFRVAATKSTEVDLFQ